MTESGEIPAQGAIIVSALRPLHTVAHGRQTFKRRAVAWARDRYQEQAGLIGDAH